MKREDISNILTNLNPAIEAIADDNVKTIINALITIIHEQQKVIVDQQKIICSQQKEIEELKEKLNTNSDNSSKPPSTEHFKSKKKKKKGKRKRGGQTGHPGITRTLLPENEVDHIEKHLPPEQCSCGGNIEVTDRYKRHQVYELPPIEIEVTEHQLFYGCCEDCKNEYSAELPSSVPTGMLGPYLLALIATLGSDYKMSKRDIARLFSDLFHFTICIATVKRAEETVSAALKAPVEEAKAYVKEQKIVNCDETSHAEWIGFRLLYYTRLIFHHWQKVRDGTMTRKKFKIVMKPIRRHVEKILMNGTRAENYKTKNTCLQILKMKEALWKFVDTVGVEPTNNIAERVLRQIVIWRKICFGTWSSNGTLYLERVMTVVATCRLQERSVFGFLAEAMCAHQAGKQAPSLLPRHTVIQLDRHNLAVAA